MSRVAVVAVLVLVLGGCTSTPAFRDAAGRTVPGSIASMETLRLGGVEQAVWFRGRDAGAQPLILLHGGPGASASALFRHFVPDLEDHFLMVYWEQRGTGRSYHRGVTRESMTTAQMVRDLDELVDHVRDRFGQDRVVLLGHSWGTILGTRYAAEHGAKVAAYIGVAQIADFAEGQRVSLEWAIDQATRRGDERALRDLRALQPAATSREEQLRLGRHVERFGGQMRGGLTTGKLILAALRAEETSFVDLWKFGAGNRFSLDALFPEYSREELTRFRHFDTPIIFMLGRHDWHVPSVLAAEYFETITAPCKRLIWFEDAAHNPPFEAPVAFVEAVVGAVRAAAAGGRC